MLVCEEEQIKNKNKYFSSITHKWTVINRFHIPFVILGHFSNQKKWLHLLILCNEDVRCGALRMKITELKLKQLGLMRQVFMRKTVRGMKT